MNYLELARKAKEEYRRKQQAGTAPEPVAAVDMVIDETVVAVLIESTVLGAFIWFAVRPDWRPDDGDTIPVFYASELPYLRTKSPEQLRNIFNVKSKSTFGGGIVRQ